MEELLTPTEKVDDLVAIAALRLALETRTPDELLAACQAGDAEALDVVCNALPAIRHHHERWDGTGYPAGLAGEAIPLVARIVNIVDTWDACTSHRPYQDALPADLVAAILDGLKGRGDLDLARVGVGGFLLFTCIFMVFIGPGLLLFNYRELLVKMVLTLTITASMSCARR